MTVELRVHGTASQLCAEDRESVLPCVPPRMHDAEPHLRARDAAKSGVTVRARARTAQRRRCRARTQKRRQFEVAHLLGTVRWGLQADARPERLGAVVERFCPVSS